MSDKVALVSEVNEKLDKFYDETYGEHHILHNQKHLEWQFKNNPFFNGTIFSLVTSEILKKLYLI